MAAAVALVAALPLVGVGTGTAQEEASFTVVKVVTGDPPAGTTFTVDVQCIGVVNAGTSGASAGTGSTTATSSTTATTTGNVHAASGAIDEIVFNAQGQVVSGVASFGPPNPAGCTATERLNGGAQTVTYACSVSGATPVAEADPTTCDGNQTVNFPSLPVQSGTITITNAFPPAPLVVEPAFTG